MRFIPSILRSFPFNVMLYFVGFLSPPLPAAAASYDRIQTLSMDEGLPHSDVNAITQDRDGYLWFATFSGLSKYDGYRLQTFGPTIPTSPATGYSAYSSPGIRPFISEPNPEG